MKKFVRSILLLMIFCPLVISYADEPNQKSQKTFVIRYTSNEPGLAIPFSSETMVITNKGSDVSSIKQSTPFTSTVTGSFVGVMVHTQEGSPAIKFEIAERTEHGESLLLSGIGQAIFAHDDANGMGFVLAK